MKKTKTTTDTTMSVTLNGPEGNYLLSSIELKRQIQAIYSNYAAPASLEQSVAKISEYIAMAMHQPMAGAFGAFDPAPEYITDIRMWLVNQFIESYNAEEWAYDDLFAAYTIAKGEQKTPDRVLAVFGAMCINKCREDDKLLEADPEARVEEIPWSLIARGLAKNRVLFYAMQMFGSRHIIVQAADLLEMARLCGQKLDIGVGMAHIRAVENLVKQLRSEAKKASGKLKIGTDRPFGKKEEKKLKKLMRKRN